MISSAVHPGVSDASSARQNGFPRRLFSMPVGNRTTSGWSAPTGGRGQPIRKTDRLNAHAPYSAVYRPGGIFKLRRLHRDGSHLNILQPVVDSDAALFKAFKNVGVGKDDCLRCCASFENGAPQLHRSASGRSSFVSRNFRVLFPPIPWALRATDSVFRCTGVPPPAKWMNSNSLAVKC